MSADIMATESVGDMLFGILKTVITVQLSVVVLLFTLGAAAFTVHHLVIPRMSAQQHDIEKGLAAKEKADEKKYSHHVPASKSGSDDKIKVDNNTAEAASSEIAFDDVFGRAININSNSESKLDDRGYDKVNKLIGHVHYKNGKKVALTLVDRKYDALPYDVKRAIVKENCQILMEASAKMRAASAKIALMSATDINEPAPTELQLQSTIKEQPMTVTQKMKCLVTKAQEIEGEKLINGTGPSGAEGRGLFDMMISISEDVKAGSATEDHAGKTVVPVAKVETIRKEIFRNVTGSSIAKRRGRILKAIKAGPATEDNVGKTIAPVT